MKVLNLQCAAQHAFEGWFASEDDFQSQLGRDLIECPVCGDVSISKGLSAPRLNLGARDSRAESQTSNNTSVAQGQGGANMAMPDAQTQAAFLKAMRQVVENTEDVGERFAEEARRIHYGETEERGIRGQATVEQARELLEEGVGVLPLPMPKAFKGTLQ